MKRSLSQNAAVKGFPGGPVIENPPARAGHAASAPGPGGSCMSQATQPACLSSWACAPEAHGLKARAPQPERPPQREASIPQLERIPCSLQLKAWAATKTQCSQT